MQIRSSYLATFMISSLVVIIHSIIVPRYICTELVCVQISPDIRRTSAAAVSRDQPITAMNCSSTENTFHIFLFLRNRSRYFAWFCQPWSHNLWLFCHASHTNSVTLPHFSVILSRCHTTSGYILSRQDTLLYICSLTIGWATLDNSIAPGHTISGDCETLGQLFYLLIS